jgi:uncharacterized membrane protein (UPF0127 family)
MLTVVLVGSVLAGCSNGPGPLARGDLTIRTSHGPIVLHVEIARSEGSRAHGLMGRTSLGSDAGMAFVFDRPTRNPFWMKDTLIPLSIAFWDRAGDVVAMLDMDPCRGDPCPLYGPGADYVGAVEATVGFFRDHGVAVGDAVTLDE